MSKHRAPARSTELVELEHLASVSVKNKVGIAVLVDGAMGLKRRAAHDSRALDDVYVLLILWKTDSRVNPRQLLYGAAEALGGCARGPAPCFF